jgi:signal recognition particle subunit SRP54
MKLIPGMGKMINEDQLRQGEVQLKKAEAMIGSMTLEERRDPDLLMNTPSRRKRIAKGSGHAEKDVTELVSNFQKMRTLMQQMGSGQFGGFPGMGMPGMGGGMPGMGDAMPGMGNPYGRPAPGHRGYQGGQQAPKKAKKDKKKKGFGTL